MSEKRRGGFFLTHTVVITGTARRQNASKFRPEGTLICVLTGIHPD